MTARLAVTRVPDREPFVYALTVEDETVGYFRYDDGWRWLDDGPGSTVDRERLLSPADIEIVELEIGAEGELVALLDAARRLPLAQRTPVV